MSLPLIMERKVRHLIGNWLDILRVRAAIGVREEGEQETMGVGDEEYHERKGRRGGRLRTVAEIKGESRGR